MERIDIESMKAGRRRKCVRSSVKQEGGKEKMREGEERGKKEERSYSIVRSLTKSHRIH